MCPCCLWLCSHSCALSRNQFQLILLLSSWHSSVAKWDEPSGGEEVRGWENYSLPALPFTQIYLVRLLSQPLLLSVETWKELRHRDTAAHVLIRVCGQLQKHNAVRRCLFVLRSISCAKHVILASLCPCSAATHDHVPLVLLMQLASTATVRN